LKKELVLIGSYIFTDSAGADARANAQSNSVNFHWRKCVFKLEK